MIDPDPSERVRSPAEVARRTLVLFGVVAVALGADREEMLAWLADHDLACDLSPLEAAFLASKEPAERDRINFSWHAERLAVLTWALRLAGRPRPDDQCDTASLQDLLPPYSEEDPAGFLASARLLPEHELHRAADELRELHWEARHASLNGMEPRQPVEIEVVQEQHHAINWITGYEGLDWDEVTTDT